MPALDQEAHDSYLNKQFWVDGNAASDRHVSWVWPNALVSEERRLLNSLDRKTTQDGLHVYP